MLLQRSDDVGVNASEGPPMLTRPGVSARAQARLQKEQEAKAAVRAKRAEERARREKEARELQIKEKLQARAQARAATKEQQQGGKTKGQVRGCRAAPAVPPPPVRAHEACLMLL